MIFIDNSYFSNKRAEYLLWNGFGDELVHTRGDGDIFETLVLVRAYTTYVGSPTAHLLEVLADLLGCVGSIADRHAVVEENKLVHKLILLVAFLNLFEAFDTVECRVRANLHLLED